MTRHILLLPDREQLLLLEIHLLRPLRAIIKPYPYLASLNPLDRSYSTCLFLADNIASLIHHYPATPLLACFFSSASLASITRVHCESASTASIRLIPWPVLSSVMLIFASRYRLTLSAT